MILMFPNEIDEIVFQGSILRKLGTAFGRIRRGIEVDGEQF